MSTWICSKCSTLKNKEAFTCSERMNEDRKRECLQCWSKRHRLPIDDLNEISQSLVAFLGQAVSLRGKPKKNIRFSKVQCPICNRELAKRAQDPETQIEAVMLHCESLTGKQDHPSSERIRQWSVVWTEVMEDFWWKPDPGKER